MHTFNSVCVHKNSWCIHRCHADRFLGSVSKYLWSDGSILCCNGARSARKQFIIHFLCCKSPKNLDINMAINIQMCVKQTNKKKTSN